MYVNALCTSLSSRTQQFQWIRLHDYMDRLMNKNSTGKVANSAEQKYGSHYWALLMEIVVSSPTVYIPEHQRCNTAQVPDVTSMLNLPKTTQPHLWYQLRNLVLQKSVGTNRSTKGPERGIEKYRGVGGWSGVQIRKYLYSEETRKACTMKISKAMAWLKILFH